MPIAYPLSEGSNTIKFHDKDFDINNTYQIRLNPVNFCFPSFTTELDGVFFCKEIVRICFTLPCLNFGAYNLEIFDVSQPNRILHKINSYYQ